MTNSFLSPEWFDALDGIHDEMPEPPAAMQGLVLNVVVQGGPDGDCEAHLASGHFAPGLAADAPTKLFVPFDVAKALFIEANPQAAMQAFMSGKIKVEGDISKMMVMQSAGTQQTPEQLAFQEKLKAITA